MLVRSLRVGMMAIVAGAVVAGPPLVVAQVKPEPAPKAKSDPALRLEPPAGRVPGAEAQKAMEKFMRSNPPRAKQSPPGLHKVEVRPVPRGEMEAPLGRIIKLQPQAPANNREVLARRYWEWLRPHVQAEYHRLCNVCNPDREQRKQIARDCVEVARTAVQDVADVLLRRGQPGSQGRIDGLRTLVEQDMVQVVKNRLGTDQSARYRREVEARDVERRETAIRAIVAELDQELFLSTQQREEIRSALDSNWSDAWSVAVDGGGATTRSLFPSLNQHVVALLSVTQRTTWILRSNGALAPTRRFVLAPAANGALVEDAELLDAWKAQDQRIPDAGFDGFRAEPIQ